MFTNRPDPNAVTRLNRSFKALLLATTLLCLSACSTRPLIGPALADELAEQGPALEDDLLLAREAMFGKPKRYVAVSVLSALLAIFLGMLAISWQPLLQPAHNELREIEAVVSQHAKRYALVPQLQDEPVGVERLLKLSQPLNFKKET